MTEPPSDWLIGIYGGRNIPPEFVERYVAMAALGDAIAVFDLKATDTDFIQKLTAVAELP